MSRPGAGLDGLGGRSDRAVPEADAIYFPSISDDSLDAFHLVEGMCGTNDWSHVRWCLSDLLVTVTGLDDDDDDSDGPVSRSIGDVWLATGTIVDFDLHDGERSTLPPRCTWCHPFSSDGDGEPPFRARPGAPRSDPPLTGRTRPIDSGTFIITTMYQSMTLFVRRNLFDAGELNPDAFPTRPLIRATRSGVATRRSDTRSTSPPIDAYIRPQTPLISETRGTARYQSFHCPNGTLRYEQEHPIRPYRNQDTCAGPITWPSQWETTAGALSNDQRCVWREPKGKTRPLFTSFVSSVPTRMTTVSDFPKNFARFRLRRPNQWTVPWVRVLGRGFDSTSPSPTGRTDTLYRVEDIPGARVEG